MIPQEYYLSVSHGVHRMPDLDAMVIKYHLDALVKLVGIPDDNQKNITWHPQEPIMFTRLPTTAIPYTILRLDKKYLVDRGESRSQSLLISQVVPFGCPTMNHWIKVCHNPGMKTKARALIYELVSMSWDARGCASKFGPGTTEILSKLPQKISVRNSLGELEWKRPCTPEVFAQRYFKLVLGRQVHMSVRETLGSDRRNTTRG